VLDPLSVALLRQAALQTANERRRVEMPPGLAKRLGGTQVFASAKPFAPPFREDLARGFRVEPVPEKQKKEQLKFSDERHAPPAAARMDVPDAGRQRKQQLEALAAEAARGNQQAKRQVQVVQQQERIEERNARRQNKAGRQNLGQPGSTAKEPRAQAERVVEPRAQGERVGAGRNPKGEAARPNVRPAPRERAQPTPAHQAPPGRAQQPQPPGQQKHGRGQAASQPAAAKPQAQKNAGKGKGRP
jgi:hypothetical protein